MKILVFLIPFFLYGFADFSICYKKYSFLKNSIPVTKNKSVTFSKHSDYLYYDPFTGLYVINHKNFHIVKFFTNAKLGWWMAGIKHNAVYGGTYASKGEFLNFSKLSVNTPENSVISDIFCRAYGIGKKRGFLDTKRLLHFVKYGYWGDVGIKVDENLIVLYVDPFYTTIKPGEKILFINNKKATPKTFTDFVLLGKKNQKVSIITNKNKYLLKIRKLKYLYTPLENYGIKVNKNLIVTLPKYLAYKYFLKSGKIIAVNHKKINNFNKLLYLLSFDKNVTITVEKNGIKIDIPLRK